MLNIWSRVIDRNVSILKFTCQFDMSLSFGKFKSSAGKVQKLRYEY